MELLLSLACITAVTLIVSMIEMTFGFKKIKNLMKQPLLEKKQLPSISIIFSALNEENDIEVALTSLLALDYPELEIIAINDRSTDATPAILNRLQQAHPERLQVHHINQLPDGWFGKNHALHTASLIAKGDWLLFTDADVSMKKNTLQHAMSYILENKLNHLTIYEHHLRNEFWLKILMLAHYITYSLVVKPWRVAYAWSKRSVGHGAFNLVNKKAYQHCGGHQSIAMECMDDLKLGQLLKKNGFKQDIVDGRDFVEREWYKTGKDMIEGCKKNSFAYFKYRPVATLFIIISAFIFFVWPLFGVFFGGYVGLVNFINITLMVTISLQIAEVFRLEKHYALSYPLGICILLYSIWNSLVAVYRNKGVVWRGTYYSFHHLKIKK